MRKVQNFYKTEPTCTMLGCVQTSAVVLIFGANFSSEQTALFIVKVETSVTTTASFRNYRILSTTYMYTYSECKCQSKKRSRRPLENSYSKSFFV